MELSANGFTTLVADLISLSPQQEEVFNPQLNKYEMKDLPSDRIWTSFPVRLNGTKIVVKVDRGQLRKIQDNKEIEEAKAAYESTK